MKFQVSATQLKRVKNPLPIPTICPNCGAAVERVSNSEIYHREYGQWPFAYKCVDMICDSYVGLHPKTDIPLGTLANKAIRTARKKAKEALKPFWEVQGMKRSAVYRWLAEKMGIANVNNCHVGWFDVEQCNRVLQICKEASK